MIDASSVIRMINNREYQTINVNLSAEHHALGVNGHKKKTFITVHIYCHYYLILQNRNKYSTKQQNLKLIIYQVD